MAQTWHDLLFAHWPIDVQELRRLVPSLLPLDTYEGQCWIGVVPFWMSHIHARGLPPFPGLSQFPELNVRTYVTLDGKPGVYFFSLDAANLPAVWAARAFYHLPYFHAEMSATIQNGWIEYRSHRHERQAEFLARYRPTASVELSCSGTLKHWYTERYCLYTTLGHNIYRAEIHHQPWPLQDAEAIIETNSMASASGIQLSPNTPLLNFAKQLEVLIWPLRRITANPHL